MLISKALSFDDILLVPSQCVVESRNDISLETEFLGFKFQLPIISANMSTVTEYAMATTMHQMGGLGIIHRMNTIKDQCQIIENCRAFSSDMVIAASIESDKSQGILRTKNLLMAGCNIICLDVAHAHSTSVFEFLTLFLSCFPTTPLIIGNVATARSVMEFDMFIKKHPHYHDKIAYKVGIGSGSQCTTRIVTGCGVPTLQSIIDIKDCMDQEMYSKCSIIADGGIKNSGDIVKALAAGADMVMVGSLLAGTSEAPGSVIKHKGKLFKVYRGSASYGQKLEQITTKGKKVFIEGEETLVSSKGSAVDVLKQLKEGILSGCSYLGVESLSDFKIYPPEFIQISNAGYVESTAHGA